MEHRHEHAHPLPDGSRIILHSHEHFHSSQNAHAVTVASDHEHLHADKLLMPDYQNPGSNSEAMTDVTGSAKEAIQKLVGSSDLSKFHGGSPAKEARYRIVSVEQNSIRKIHQAGPVRSGNPYEARRAK